MVNNLDRKIISVFCLYRKPQNRGRDNKVYFLVVQAVIDEMLKFVAEELGEIKVKVIEKEVMDAYEKNKITREELTLMTYSIIIKTLVKESLGSNKDLILYLDKRLDYFLINLKMSYNRKIKK